MYNSSSNTFINNNFSNSNATSGYGIYVYYNSNNNLFINNTCNNNHAGIVIQSSSNNTVSNNTCSNNTYVGILLTASSNNIFTRNCVQGNPTQGAFRSQGQSSGNVVTDLCIRFPYPTNVSFTYSGSIRLNGVPEGLIPPDPQPLRNISAYVEIIPESSSVWVFLNVSYAGKQLTAQEASSLAIYRWNGTDWVLPATGEGGYGVNTVNKYVYANITQFSTFAPLYSPESHPAPVGGIIIPVESVPVPPAVPLAAAVVVAMAVAAVLAAVALMRPWRRLLR